MNGMYLPNASLIKTDYKNPDTDGDGLLDGEEIDTDIEAMRCRGGVKYYFLYSSYPDKADSDGDGLLDGKCIRKDENDENSLIIAPMDQNKLDYNGPTNMWKTHIKTAKSNDIPTKIDGWYGYTNPNHLNNVGYEGFYSFACELTYLEEYNKIKLSDIDKAKIFAFAFAFINSAIVGINSMGDGLYNSDDVYKEWLNTLSEDGIIKLDSVFLNTTCAFLKLSMIAVCNLSLSTSHLLFDSLLNVVNDCILVDEERTKILASLGSRALNFKKDSDENIHSQHILWQSIFGYNNIYDNAFSEYTDDNMAKEKFSFTVDDTEYVLWIWRGDYLNLGAGSEMGIYYRPNWMSQSPNDFDHYFADQNLTLPMQLYLYDYNSSSDIDNILSWEPTEPQWWITGFNPKTVGNVDVDTQVMIGKVKFENKEMYDKFEIENKFRVSIEDFLFFDKDNYTVWICWFKKGTI